MKIKYVLSAVAFLIGLTGCTADLMNYNGADMVRFSGDPETVFSFAYYTDQKTEDVIDVNVMTVGEVADHPRTVRFEQVTKEWKYNYDPQDPNRIVDSTYIDMPYPAEEGKHFHIENATGNAFTIPAGEHSYRLKIMVKRSDNDLKKHARTLHLKLIPNEHFGILSDVAALKKITISDKLEKPRQWKGYYCDLYIGNWSETKHRFMINVTGQKWDDDFIKVYIKSFDEAPLRNFYLMKIKKALEAYNADPSNNPPMKDENGKEIVFP
ncbi:MAG: DUF4843 domain-containing protein [Prevotella sp.]|nr:DUF4843 domain-containing protein [Prevotella sp.]